MSADRREDAVDRRHRVTVQLPGERGGGVAPHLRRFRRAGNDRSHRRLRSEPRERQLQDRVDRHARHARRRRDLLLHVIERVAVTFAVAERVHADDLVPVGERLHVPLPRPARRVAQQPVLEDQRRAAAADLTVDLFSPVRRERHVEIVADRGIDAMVGAEGWEKICKAMEADFKAQAIFPKAA